MEKLAIKLKIIQKVSNTERVKNGLERLGKGHFDAYRFNPYNPLAYIVLICIFIIGLIMYGFVGIFEKAQNPFLWD